MRSFIGLCLLLCVSSASAVTLDFEGVVADDESDLYAYFAGTGFLDYSEDGFRLSSDIGAVSGKDAQASLGLTADAFDSAYLSWCGADWSPFADDDRADCRANPLSLKHSTSAFSLVSADFAFASVLGRNAPDNVDSYSIRIDGQSALSGEWLRAIAYVSPGEVTAFSFGSEWSNLQSVKFTTDHSYGCSDFHDPEECFNDPVPSYGVNAAIDNIVVNVVPIPAAAWLFFSALVSLGWITRK